MFQRRVDALLKVENYSCLKVSCIPIIVGAPLLRSNSFYKRLNSFVVTFFFLSFRIFWLYGRRLRPAINKNLRLRLPAR